MTRRYALRDDQWDRIKDLLPGREDTVGVTAKDNRLFVDAMLYRYRAGIPWRDLRPQRCCSTRQLRAIVRPTRAPLVTRANEIFISIAGHQPPDDFDKLDVDYQKPNDPRLIALRANGVAYRVEAMSEGTHDQLWLALRIAALELCARDAEPMPFLADDLFASSDAVRTGVGIRYLAELARHTQVILFTHHDYVIDAVRLMVPDAQIHELTREKLLP